MALHDEPTGSPLGVHMNLRRRELRLSWEDVAAGADITATHLRRIRRAGTGFGDVTEELLEETLQWEPGSIAAIQRGGVPTPLRQDATVTPETVTARAVIPTPTVSAVPTPGEGESAGMSQVDAIRAAMRAELTVLRDEARQRDEENRAALDKLAEEFRAFRDQSGA